MNCLVIHLEFQRRYFLRSCNIHSISTKANQSQPESERKGAALDGNGKISIKITRIDFFIGILDWLMFSL